MKLPGPDHPITITANPKRVRVSAGGVVIADTTHALTLKEASYPAVQYVPRRTPIWRCWPAPSGPRIAPTRGMRTISASMPTARAGELDLDL